MAATDTNARRFDPNDPPRFGEWVQMDGAAPRPAAAVAAPVATRAGGLSGTAMLLILVAFAAGAILGYFLAKNQAQPTTEKKQGEIHLPKNPLENLDPRRRPRPNTDNPTPPGGGGPVETPNTGGPVTPGPATDPGTTGGPVTPGTTGGGLPGGINPGVSGGAGPGTAGQPPGSGSSGPPPAGGRPGDPRRPNGNPGAPGGNIGDTGAGGLSGSPGG